MCSEEYSEGKKGQEVWILLRIVNAHKCGFEFSILENHLKKELLLSPEISFFISTADSSEIQKDSKYKQK